MDESALQRLHDMYDGSFRRLVGQLYAVCGDMAEAEDVVQEAFVRAAQHQRQFARADNREAWLRTVAVNVSRTRHRRRVLGARLHAQHARERVAPDVSADHVALVDALRQIPRAQREAIALHHLADLPVDEVARTVGAAVNTVKSRLRRGRAVLADLLTDHEESQHAGHR